MAPRKNPTVFEIWPENRQALEVFLTLETQWRWVAVGMGAPARVGLDYTAFPPVLDLMGIPGAERSNLFNDVTTIEKAALRALAGLEDSDA